MYFRGKLLQEGRLILAEVSGDIDEQVSPTGVPSQTGRMEVPPRKVRSGETYELELDTGRALTILVWRVEQPAWIAYFKGTAP
jgi:hypothetical protein